MIELLSRDVIQFARHRTLVNLANANIGHLGSYWLFRLVSRHLLELASQKILEHQKTQSEETIGGPGVNIGDGYVEMVDSLYTPVNEPEWQPGEEVLEQSKPDFN